MWFCAKQKSLITVFLLTFSKISDLSQKLTSPFANCVTKLTYLLNFMIIRLLNAYDREFLWSPSVCEWRILLFLDLCISKSIECWNMSWRNRIQYINRNVCKKEKLCRYLQNEVVSKLKASRNSWTKDSTAV